MTAPVTPQKTKPVLGTVPLSPFASKKFVAFMVSEMTWKILAAAVLCRKKDSIPDQAFYVLLAIILVSGFVEVGYIIGQGGLDKFTRVASIIVGGGHGHGVEMKGMKIVAPPQSPETIEAEPPPEETEEPPSERGE